MNREIFSIADSASFGNLCVMEYNVCMCVCICMCVGVSVVSVSFDSAGGMHGVFC